MKSVGLGWEQGKNLFMHSDNEKNKKKNQMWDDREPDKETLEEI